MGNCIRPRWEYANDHDEFDNRERRVNGHSSNREIRVMDDRSSMSVNKCVFKLSHNKSMAMYNHSDGLLVVRRLWSHRRTRLSPNAYILDAIFSDNDEYVRIWRPDAFIFDATFSANDAWVTTLSCSFESSYNNSQIGQGSVTIDIWNLVTGECLHTRVAHNVVCGTYAPHEGILATLACKTGVTGACLQIINIRTDATLSIMLPGRHLTCAFNHDASQLLVGKDGPICIPVPEIFRMRCKLLLLIIVGHRRTHAQLRLPPELWDWMYDQALV